MKQIIEIDEDLQKALTEYFEGKRSYVGLDNGVKLLEAVKNGKELSSSEKPNKSEIPNSSIKNDLEVDKAEQKTDYTWEDVSSVMDAMEYKTNSLIENIKSEILHFANAHCSGDDINIYDVFKVIDDCCEVEE